MAIVRAKFKCTAVTTFEGGAEKVELSPVYGKDGTPNAQWSKWTPSGACWLQITNPDACGKFKPGVEYFLDFTEAPAEE